MTDLEIALLAVLMGALRDDCPADAGGNAPVHGCVSSSTPLAKQLPSIAESGAGEDWLRQPPWLEQQVGFSIETERYPVAEIIIPDSEPPPPGGKWQVLRVHHSHLCIILSMPL